MQVFEIQSCEQGVECLNSLEHLGHGNAKCGVCRFAPNAPSSYSSHWKPTDRKRKHPTQEAARREKKVARVTELRLKKASRDQAKRKISVLAERAEKQTQSSFFRATKNSGRSNKDGDHTAVGQVTLDTKLQTGRENPVVLLDELAKVQLDAGRAGNWLGVLVLRNKHGKGVVAIDEVDFARLIKLLE